MGDLGLQALQSVAAAEAPVLRLEELSQNFPSHASALSALKVQPDTRDEAQVCRWVVGACVLAVCVLAVTVIDAASLKNNPPPPATLPGPFRFGRPRMLSAAVSPNPTTATIRDGNVRRRL